MKVLRLARALMDRNAALFVAIVLAATIVPQIVGVVPASADDGGYPWISATLSY